MTLRLLPLACLCALLLALGACKSSPGPGDSPDAEELTTAPASKPASAPATAPASDGTVKAPPTPEGMAVATFAGGCFWCMEPPFEKVPGVQSVLSGYTGGPEQGPTYKQVGAGKTGHTEAVYVTFDPNKVTYKVLVEVYWRSMDPTDAGGQFADRGSQYRPGIFFHNEEQKKIAAASKQALIDSKRFDKPIAVPLVAAGDFWVAEAYHQDYYKTNTPHYKRYSVGSGRVGFLEKAWKDAPPIEGLK